MDHHQNMAQTPASPLPETYSAGEIAQAAGVPSARVDALVASGALRPVTGTTAFFAPAAAVAAVRTLRADGGRGAAMLFDNRPEFVHASPRVPIVVSSALHVGIGIAIVLISTLGLPAAEADAPVRIQPELTRLVFIATPGPGGGGGGGGLRQKPPPPRAQRKGKASLDSPIPVRKAPKPVEPAPRPEPPPPVKVEPEPLPPVVAPVATVAANQQDRPGVVDAPADDRTNSRGPGVGGGAGTGAGTGLGSGDGSGIGEGSGGGMGGGPYRAGSGVTAPRLLREVKAGYTEEARLRNLEGEVVLEIVVRRDGSVGDVRLLHGLPHGLNERAIAAVRQWRFAPAARLGQPVDVIVEVAVEFKLR